jgi:hypothetical protein
VKEINAGGLPRVIGTACAGGTTNAGIFTMPWEQPRGPNPASYYPPAPGVGATCLLGSVKLKPRPNATTAEARPASWMK